MTTISKQTFYLYLLIINKKYKEVKYIKKLKNILSENLYFYRKREGLSQEKLAEKSGLDRTHISAIECGRRNVSLKSLEKISSALNIDAFYLLKERGKNE